MREVLNAIFYQNRSGCQWRMLPLEFGAWSTIHGYYRRWRRDGTWAKIHDTLRERVRLKAGKQATPSAAIIDSQSVKSAEKGALAEAMTPAKRSSDASATSPSTRWD